MAPLIPLESGRPKVRFGLMKLADVRIGRLYVIRHESLVMMQRRSLTSLPESLLYEQRSYVVAVEAGVPYGKSRRRTGVRVEALVPREVPLFPRLSPPSPAEIAFAVPLVVDARTLWDLSEEEHDRASKDARGSSRAPSSTSPITLGFPHRGYRLEHVSAQRL